MKILFLDHKDRFQSNVIELLKKNNHEVLISLSLNEAFESFENDRPDLLILNWESKEIRNLQFYSSIQSIAKKDYNPIVILAQDNEIKDYTKYLKIDQVYWFSKSKHEIEFVDWVEKQGILKGKYTEVVQTKTCLQETCHITTAILDAVPSALVVVDDKMKITNSNRSFTKLFDLDPSKIPNTHICDLIHKEDTARSKKDHGDNCQFLQAVERLSPSNKSLIGEEVALVYKDGELKYFTIITSRLPSTNYRLLVDIRDITERKKQDEDMALRDRLASLGGLSIGVAHEINNPNGAIRLGIKNISTIFEMLTPFMNGVKKEQPDLKLGAMLFSKMIDKIPLLCNGILNATDRIAAVVDNLKKFGRKDTASAGNTMNINNIVKNSVQLTNHVLNETGTLDLQLDENIPLVEGYETEIEQVIINLISNACDSIKDKKNLLEADYAGQVTIKTHYKGLVLIEVTDNGMGISDEIKDKIFEPYYTSKPYGVGTGLGLSISMKIIKKHNGNMTCNSEKGKGTTFCIELIPTSPKL